MAAIIAVISGALQCFSLWLLPTSPGVLLTALCGAAYVLLALGLFGISTLSLLLAICALPLRSWFAVFPIELPAWELLRIAADLAIAALCLPVLWRTLDPGYTRIEPGHRLQEKNITQDDLHATQTKVAPTAADDGALPDTPQQKNGSLNTEEPVA